MYSDEYAYTYSTARGLENELYQIQGARTGAPDTYASRWAASAPRAARGIRFDSGAYLTIDANASDFAGINRPFSYASEQQFTINIWIDLTGAAHSVSDTPTLFSWGDIEIDLEAKAGIVYTPRAKAFSATPISSNVDISPDTTNLITLTYGKPTGQNYYEEILYVNGVEAARSTSTDPTATKIASFTATGYIGRNTPNDATALYESGLLLFDMRALPHDLDAGPGYLQLRGRRLCPYRYRSQRERSALPWALVTYQFHSTFTGDTIPDYSTNAFNAQLSGTTTFITGGLQTTLAQPGDNHIITQVRWRERV